MHLSTNLLVQLPSPRLSHQKSLLVYLTSSLRIAVVALLLVKELVEVLQGLQSRLQSLLCLLQVVDVHSILLVLLLPQIRGRVLVAVALRQLRSALAQLRVVV